MYVSSYGLRMLDLARPLSKTASMLQHYNFSQNLFQISVPVHAAVMLLTVQKLHEFIEK